MYGYLRKVLWDVERARVTYVVTDEWALGQSSLHSGVSGSSLTSSSLIWEQFWRILSMNSFAYAVVRRSDSALQ